MAAPLSDSDRAFRAVCLGAAGLVIMPMVAFLAARPILLAIGVCELPVFCDADASFVAALAALPGAAAGAGLSYLLDRRRPQG